MNLVKFGRYLTDKQYLILLRSSLDVWGTFPICNMGLNVSKCSVKMKGKEIEGDG